MKKYLIRGELYDAIKFGDEEDGILKNTKFECEDCKVHPGEYHYDKCEMEICPRCGGQFTTCECGWKIEITKDNLRHLKKYIKEQEMRNQGLFEDQEKINKMVKEFNHILENKDSEEMN